MSDFPTFAWPPLNVITPWHTDSLGYIPAGGVGTLANTSSAAFVDELISFHPFVIRQTSTAVKMSYMVGATAAGTVDLGIYDSQENLLVSTGLTAQGTINTLQEFDITDTVLRPGVYYMAIKCTDGTGTNFGISHTDENVQTVVLLYEEAGGAGAALPTTATMVPATGATIREIAMGVHFNTLI